MEYNFLLLEDNKLSIKNSEKFLSLNQENLGSLKAEYSLISTYEIMGKNPFSSKVLELLKNNEVVINIGPIWGPMGPHGTPSLEFCFRGPVVRDTVSYAPICFFYSIPSGFLYVKIILK